MLNCRFSEIRWTKRYPGHQIALVGHSWGGHTAYHVADRVGLKKIVVDLLVTLDAVGTSGFFWPPGSSEPGNPPKPQMRPTNTKTWLNVYVQDPPGLPARPVSWRSPNTVAMGGQPWRKLTPSGILDGEWTIASTTHPENSATPEYHFDDGHALTNKIFDHVYSAVEEIK
ncbi:alpha/beta hydrolase [Lacibacterium aquatile]|uniref:Alpha/beta hydrolase n=1 Tax=Lacibacterium aquatile TaxID=1168082 RepID=A0ABW5DTU3_9PROT